MKKSWIIGAGCAAVITAGTVAAAQITGYTYSNDASAATTETITAAETTTTNTDIAAINEAVEDGVQAIQSAANEAVSQVQAAATTAETMVATEEATTVATTTTTVKTSTETYSINVSSENQYGTLCFTSVKIDYDYNFITLYYNVASSICLMPDSSSTYCIDKENNKLSVGMFLTSNAKLIYDSDGKSIEKYEYTDQPIEYGKFTDASALSTITVTYAFEGIDPVTVTIDIPIE